jgi:hypothetical protein
MRSWLSIVAKVLVLSVLSSGCGSSTDGVGVPFAKPNPVCCCGCAGRSAT